MTRTIQIRLLGFCILGCAVLASGCHVGQRPGKGLVMTKAEPVTGAVYNVYLPEDYVHQKDHTSITDHKWPVVVTLHGMKPFDSAGPQIREWQEEADRYGFIVVAPVLRSADLMHEFPFRHVTSSLKADERDILAILQHLSVTTDMDPNHVLATSFSSGGYVAHYMLNHHPDWFSCLAVRQSNFSSSILDENQVSQYRNHPIAMFFTENDLGVCARESKDAARWYARRGFQPKLYMLSGLGHERTPSVAAQFFARTCNADPKTPPEELTRMQVTEVPISDSEKRQMLASADRNRSRPIKPSEPIKPRTKPVRTEPKPTVDAEPIRITPTQPVERTPSPQNKTSEPSLEGPITPERDSPNPVSEQQNPVRIRLSQTIGVAPMLLSYSAVVPGSIRRGSYFLWTDNGEPISNGINGQKYLTTPGQHRIEVLVTTADGKEWKAGQTVKILKPIRKKD